MKKVLPYLYIFIGIVIIFGTMTTFFEDTKTYRVILNITTENKYLFLLVRALFAGWFLADGIKRLKQNQAG